MAAVTSGRRRSREALTSAACPLARKPARMYACVAFQSRQYSSTNRACFGRMVGLGVTKTSTSINFSQHSSASQTLAGDRLLLQVADRSGPHGGATGQFVVVQFHG